MSLRPKENKKMPTQATIPRKTLNYHRKRYETKPNLNNIFKQFQPYRGYWKDNTNTRRENIPKKTEEIKHLTTNPKEENHTHTHTHTHHTTSSKQK